MLFRSQLVYPAMKRLGAFLFLAVIGSFGCVTDTAVQHLIRVNPDGSGIAVIIFLDLRSDAVSDSAYAEDLNLLLDFLAHEKISEFEKNGKKILKKELYLDGDSLSLRVEYEFRDLRSIDGIRITDDEIFFVVNKSKRILRTNGKIKNDSGDGKRLVWKTGTRQISYSIEDVVPSEGQSLSLAYRLHLEETAQ